MKLNPIRRKKVSKKSKVIKKDFRAPYAYRKEVESGAFHDEYRGLWKEEDGSIKCDFSFIVEVLVREK